MNTAIAGHEDQRRHDGMHAREPVEPRPAEHRRRRAQHAPCANRGAAGHRVGCRAEGCASGDTRRVSRFIARPGRGLASTLRRRRVRGAAAGSPSAHASGIAPAPAGRSTSGAVDGSLRRREVSLAGAAQQRFADAPLQRLALARAAARRPGSRPLRTPAPLHPDAHRRVSNHAAWMLRRRATSVPRVDGHRTRRSTAASCSRSSSAERAAHSPSDWALIAFGLTRRAH